MSEAKSSYRAARTELVKQHEAEIACRSCNKAVPQQTLNDFGGRCFPCFQAYCRDLPPIPAAPKFEGLRAWARKLEARHKAGERLTPAQIGAYTSALRSEPQEEA